MYNEENSRKRQNTSELELQSYSRRYNARMVAHRRRQRQRRLLLLFSLLIIIATIVIASIFIFKPKDKPNSSTPDIISGTWVYDQYTKYEFDGQGKGCMCLENTHYEYSYKINEDILSIDFENEAVHDCAYTFKIKKDKLTIVGGEGTTGGTYLLTKQN